MALRKGLQFGLRISTQRFNIETKAPAEPKNLITVDGKTGAKM